MNLMPHYWPVFQLVNLKTAKNNINCLKEGSVNPPISHRLQLWLVSPWLTSIITLMTHSWTLFQLVDFKIAKMLWIYYIIKDNKLCIYSLIHNSMFNLDQGKHPWKILTLVDISINIVLYWIFNSQFGIIFYKNIPYETRHQTSLLKLLQNHSSLYPPFLLCFFVRNWQRNIGLWFFICAKIKYKQVLLV